MTPKTLSYVAAVAFSFIADAASAATITFQFSGTVTYGAPLAVQPGEQIVGTYSYDTDTAPEFTYKGYADYQIPAPHIMAATVGAYTLSTSNLNVSVWNHSKGNVEDMVMISGGPAVMNGTTFPDGAFGFQLASAPHNNRVLNSTKLPSAFNVSDFDAGSTLNYGFFQSDGGPQGQLLQFTVDSIVVLQTTP